MLPIVTYISAPDRPKAPTLRLSSPSRLLAPRLFCLFDGEGEGRLCTVYDNKMRNLGAKRSKFADSIGGDE